MSWSERNEEADAQEDGAGDHQVPDGDEERATELLAHLRDAAAVEDAARARDGGVEGAELRGGEEAREHSPEHARDGVGVEHGQGVVDLHEQGGFLVQDHHREPRDAARERAHQHRRPRVHQPCATQTSMAPSCACVAQ